MPQRRINFGVTVECASEHRRPDDKFNVHLEFELRADESDWAMAAAKLLNGAIEYIARAAGCSDHVAYQKVLRVAKVFRESGK